MGFFSCSLCVLGVGFVILGDFFVFVFNWVPAFFFVFVLLL